MSVREAIAACVEARSARGMPVTVSTREIEVRICSKRRPRDAFDEGMNSKGRFGQSSSFISEQVQFRQVLI